MPKSAARALLTDFLKTRRTRLDPRQFGFDVASYRRKPGLRRSEVAELAGISTAWYTLFEMGQERAMTLRVIEPVAKALRLNEDERDYLYDLVRSEPPREHAFELSPSITNAFRLVQDVSLVAYDRWHTPLLWNLAAEAMNEISDKDALRTNALWRLFYRPDLRNKLPEWEHHAHLLIGLFRRALGRDPENGEAQSLLEALCQNSEFAEMWRAHDVLSLDSDSRSNGDRIFHLHHSRVGTIAYYRLGIAIPDSAGGYFRIQTPSDDASRRRFSLAVSHHIAEKGGRRLYGNVALLDPVQLEHIGAAFADRHSARHGDNLTWLRDPFRK